jgi:predicted aspartyl protease
MSIKNPPSFAAFTAKAERLMPVLQSTVYVNQVIPGKITPEKSYIAIWDTGATSTVITPKVVNELGLIASGKTNIQGVAGSKENIDTFIVSIILPNKVRVNSVRAAEVPQIAGAADILIGMDIITLGDFSVTNFDKKTVLSFRIPSTKVVDYVEEANIKNTQFSTAKKTILSPDKKYIIAPTKNHRVDGNLPCPCGSGKKWKKCHGKQKAIFG